jgi:hypothetical protein
MCAVATAVQAVSLSGVKPTYPRAALMAAMAVRAATSGFKPIVTPHRSSHSEITRTVRQIAECMDLGQNAMELAVLI